MSNQDKYEVVIGLEVHAQLLTRSKLFCGDSAAFGGSGGHDGAVPSYEVLEPEGAIKIVDLLAASGLAASKSAARRLIEQGGVRLGERKVTSIDELVRADDVGEGMLLHAGKKNLRRITFVSRGSSGSPP